MRLVARRSFYVSAKKIQAPPLIVITGEEFTRYAGELYLDKWIRPHVDTTQWEFFDLSCKSRDDTDDQVLRDAVEAGRRAGAIYKEPTITPTAEQVREFGLRKQWGSPNGLMRRGWNGITISRDTIHVEGMDLGYKKPVLFDRHAVGGEYAASFEMVGKGRAETIFYPEDGSAPIKVADRQLTDHESALVVYDNPYDNIRDMGKHFFGRCLEAKVPPCIVSKHTVFKWQEAFFHHMKEVYDATFKDQFVAAGLTLNPTGDLQHYLSDVATMQLIRWTEGGFGMAALNYDGDILTDEVSQIHRSPGFLSSVLNGINRDTGAIIKEFEASHGTVTDMWHAHLRGEETSLNPLSMMEALIGAMQHSAKLAGGNDELVEFSQRLQKAIHGQMVDQGTRDLDGENGLTTEQFVDAVAKRLNRSQKEAHVRAANKIDPRKYDEEALQRLFEEFDIDGSGSMNYKEFAFALKKLGVAPLAEEELEKKVKF